MDILLQAKLIRHHKGLHHPELMVRRTTGRVRNIAVRHVDARLQGEMQPATCAGIDDLESASCFIGSLTVAHLVGGDTIFQGLARGQGDQPKLVRLRSFVDDLPRVSAWRDGIRHDEQAVAQTLLVACETYSISCLCLNLLG